MNVVSPTSRAMVDSERKRTSVRANQLEKKRFEMMMTAFDSAKRNVALEMKKSQVDVKRRLKRYQDRQREINRPGSPLASMDDYLLKQLRRRSRPSQELQHGSTSPSSHTPHHTNHHGPPYAYITSGPEAVASTSSSSISSKVEDDLNMFFHRDKSKADLRPYTAWSTIKDASSSKEHGRNHHSNTFGGSPKGGLRFLQLRGGSLGTPSRQVRYLDDEEVERRRQLHRYLLGRYRHLEHVRLQSINDRVGQFCRGQSGVTAAPSRPPSERGDSAGLSLPPGVPPMVHRALRVRPQSDPSHHA